MSELLKKNIVIGIEKKSSLSNHKEPGLKKKLHNEVGVKLEIYCNSRNFSYIYIEKSCNGLAER